MKSPGTFVLSFDLELAWGELHRERVGHERLLEARRRLPELLRVLERHGVAATFAVVGHLFLEGCNGHPEMPRPRLGFGPADWLGQDPASDEARDPLWYAPSLVRLVREASPGHDVGAHGFSHVPLDEAGCGPEVAASEIAASARALRLVGLDPGSFVFPRNGIKYRQLLEQEGFRCYRAVERRWYQGCGRGLRKTAHMLDQALAVTPPTGLPRRAGGLVEIPSSMLFLSREGFRRHIPQRARVSRALRGLERASLSGQMFHLWMHAEDLVPEAPLMLEALDVVLAEAARRRARGELEISTMANAAASVPA